MDVKVTTNRGSYTEHTSALIYRHLDGDDAWSNHDKTPDNCAEFLGDLVSLLMDRGVITVKDLVALGVTPREYGATLGPACDE